MKIPRKIEKIVRNRRFFEFFNQNITSLVLQISEENLMADYKCMWKTVNKCECYSARSNNNRIVEHSTELPEELKFSSHQTQSNGRDKNLQEPIKHLKTSTLPGSHLFTLYPVVYDINTSRLCYKRVHHTSARAARNPLFN